MLSNGFQPIHVFRRNPKTKIVFVLAGITESMEILIYPDGIGRFAREET